MPPPWPGELAWLPIEYLGGARIEKPWPGLFTGATYWFGGDKRDKYVDSRDAIKWLTMRRGEGIEPIFRIANANQREANQ